MALVMAVGAVVLSWVFPVTIGVAMVGWTTGSAAGFVGAPIAGHPMNMLPMALHVVLSVFIANGIRRALDQAGRRV